MNFSTKTVLCCAAAGWAIAAPGHVLAQDADGDEANSADDSGSVIVVTARKKEESILSVPIAVTAVSGEELQAAQLEDLEDIAQVTPGLNFESFFTNPGRQDSSPFIRGVIIDANLPDPTATPVGVFIDGIFVTGGTRAIGIEDLERVEVIKGPQSATFGRATFAGAINFVTVDPSDEFGGRVSVSAATRDMYEATATLEGPIAGDVLRGRLTGRYKSKNGHYANAGDPGSRLGDEETWSVGATLLFEPTDNLRIKARGFYSKINDGPAAVALIRGTENNFGPFGDGDEAIFAGTIPRFNSNDVVGLNTDDATYALTRTALENSGQIFFQDGGLDNGFGLEVTSKRASLDAEYVFPGSDITLNAIFGWSEETLINIYDNDFTTDPSFAVANPNAFEDYTIEARLSGSSLGGRLDWSFGGNYYEAEYLNNFTFIGYFGGDPAAGAFTFGPETGFTSRKPKNYGVFGRLSFDITDSLTLTTEGRYQWDEVNTGQVDTMGVRTPQPGAPATFENFLPRVTLDYKPSDNTLLYATYAEGNFPGGFNLTFNDLTPDQALEVQQNFPGASGTFGEEKLENYEIGWKQSTADNRLSFALSAFFMKRSDEVVSTVLEVTNDQTGPNDPPTESFTLLLNAQTTEITGFELEGNFAASDQFQVRGTLAYIYPEVAEFPEFAESVGDVRDVLGSDATSVGQLAPRFSDWQGSLSGTFTEFQAVGDMDFYTRADYFYTGRRLLTLVNVGRTPPSHVVNLRTGLKSDSLTLEAFVLNLLNEDTVTAGNNTSDLSFTRIGFGREATSVGLRDRRQFGVRATFNF